MAHVSVAVVDGHPVLLEGIGAVIARQGGFSLVAVGSTASEICSITRCHRPDAMIIDLSMPGEPFIAIADAARAAPKMAIIVFTASDCIFDAVKALDAGASGYVLKASSSKELIEAIDMTLRGEIYITPSLATKVIGALRQRALERQVAVSPKLSVREDQIVKLLLCGKRNRDIGRILSLSEKTVKAYMTRLMHKLDARSRLEVVVSVKKLYPTSFGEDASAHSKLPAASSRGGALSAEARH
jgi:DNA-binding NarL/FixJ family response regulator